MDYVGSLIDKRCAGCLRRCSERQYIQCVMDDYSFYDGGIEVEELKVVMAKMPKYFAENFSVSADEIKEGLNRFFRTCPSFELKQVLNLTQAEDLLNTIMIIVEKTPKL